VFRRNAAALQRSAAELQENHCRLNRVAGYLLSGVQGSLRDNALGAPISFLRNNAFLSRDARIVGEE